MYTLFAWISRFSAPATSSATADIARRLMESAESRAGRHPHQAQQLRAAACAYLSVVR
jgi:hypothetical protein